MNSELFVSFQYKAKSGDEGFGHAVFKNINTPKDFHDVKNICNILKDAGNGLEKVFLINWKEIKPRNNNIMNSETFIIILFLAFLTAIIGLSLAIIGVNPFDTLGGNVGALDNYLEI